MNIQKCREIFSIRTGYTVSELRRRYKRLVKEWHPDRFVNHPQLKSRAERKIKDINIAYEQLIVHASPPGTGMARGTQKGKGAPGPETGQGGLISDTIENLRVLVNLILRFVGRLAEDIFIKASARKSKRIAGPPERPIPMEIFSGFSLRNPGDFEHILRDAQRVRNLRVRNTEQGGGPEKGKRGIEPRNRMKTFGGGRVKKIGKILPVTRIGKVE